MKRHILLQTDVAASRLGFGCVQLTAHRNRREALSLLEHAFSLGITHFDVARAYGFGRAEGILREFLRRKRHTVTLATKFGIEPPPGLAGNVRIINALKRILGPFPGLLRQAKHRGAAMVKTGIFTPESAIRSLETSLRELGTDYVDIFLLHEATLADASGAQLVEALLSQVAKGKVRHLGVASDFCKLQGVADRLAAAYGILQFNDNAVDRSIGKLSQRDHRLLITHSIFTPAESLWRVVQAHPQIARDYSLRMNIDLTEPSAIHSLLLRFAIWSNAKGIVLFSSKNPQHIAFNVREADSEPYDDARMLQFVECVDQFLATMSPDRGSTNFRGTGSLSGSS
jgi:D-threo-aldose 1-dehydrogenase